MTRIAVHERVVQFGPQRGLVGILSQPAERVSRESPYIILLNSGIIHRVGSNRLYVELARALAAHGISALRFDLSGIGDSARRTDAGSVRDAVRQDVDDAIAYLATEHAVDRVVLFGLCSGAFDAFRSACDNGRVVGAFMVDMPGPFQTWRHTLHHVGNRLLNSASEGTIVSKLLERSTATVKRAIVERESPAAAEPSAACSSADGYIVGARGGSSRELMSEQLEALLARDVQLYFLFTAGLELNYNHASQFQGAFPRAASHAAVSHAFFPDRDHSFATRDARTRLIALVEGWMLATWLRQQDAA